MIEELISKVFATRNITQIAHWKSKGVGSYAKHVALGDFYEGIVGALDSIVECHQGLKGLIGNVNQTKETQPSDLVAYLKKEALWIEQNRLALSSWNNSIGNLVDGLQDIYLKTIYKLENLQ